MSRDTIQPFAEHGNYTEFHNLTLDYIMPRVSGSAWKVLSLIMRKTKGWQKSSDAISYQQIQDGTGIKTDATVSRALKELLALGCIRSKSGDLHNDATRYALDKTFSISAQEVGAGASKNEARKSQKGASKTEAQNQWGASKIEARGASKIEAAGASKIEDTKESKKNTNKEVSTERGGKNTHASVFLPPPRPNPSPKPNPPADELPEALSFTVVEAMREVAGLPPWAGMSSRQQQQLPDAVAFVLGECDGDIEQAAREIRERFAAPIWDLNNPVNLAQFRPVEWARFGAKAAARKVAPTTPRRKTASEQFAEADRLIAELEEKIAAEDAAREGVAAHA